MAQTMVDYEKIAGVINDLAKINNDRIEGYTRAIKELKAEDSDLKVLFEGMKTESQEYKRELSNLVRQYGDEPEQGTRADGKIYRAWMDVKATFSGNSRKSVLENCEFGEDAAQKAYRSALSENDLPSDVTTVISRQQGQLKASHDKIKALRDSQK